ncbi:MAG: ZIP family metal transporter [Crocinitomicaceae bacterium]|nr:ZIP family metal transporter [Crocinitomicaceae bacterium]
MIKELLLYSGFAGITVFIGGLLANWFNHHVPDSPIKPIITHTVIAFGGGIILSAVALVLIPKGMEQLSIIPLCISFSLGAILFAIADYLLAKKGGKMGTLLAMLMDFIPESIALGAVFAVDPSTAALLAIFIGLQNLPEAFNSYRDLVMSGYKAKTTLIIFFFMSFLGMAGALIGHFFLRSSPDITAHLMVFSGGGILYLVFQDIIPEVKFKNSYSISLAGTLGFLIGIIGEKLL